ncbi:MarR family transcriptional regulator [Pectobacterium carotovorum subsp. carotovorum]|nr:MarR family transcriptional regulator [Pectobacterium carotovorum subsp. carotovorum]
MLKIKPGLGELLRYTAELVDKGSEANYRALSLNYRPRFTPILRAMAAGAQTVQDITESTHLTQGAISQSVALMEQDGILVREQLSDGRKFALRLTPAGIQLVAQLETCWEAIFLAIEQLEKEAGWPLMKGLEELASALEQRDFEKRIQIARAELHASGDKDD